MGAQALRLLATLDTLDTLDTECDSVAQLGEATTEAFATHPHHQIITSFPGLGDLTGARMLAEIGDDRTRFTDARALKAYAGSAPHHPGVRTQHLHHPPEGQKQSTGRHRLDLGICRLIQVRGSSSPLPPPPRSRGSAHRSPAQPVQPPPRLPSPLPANRPNLRRNHGVPITLSAIPTSPSLTTTTDRRSIGTRSPGPATASTTPSHGRQISAKAYQPVALRVRPRPEAARRRSSRSDHNLGPVHADPHSCNERSAHPDLRHPLALSHAKGLQCPVYWGFQGA